MPVARLRALADPVADWPFLSPPPGDPVTAEWLAEIDQYDAPLDDAELWLTQCHLGRIARLMRHRWDDPIEVDVGCLGLFVPWPVIDGNHRFYAAIMRGDEHITVDVAGDLDLANELLAPTVLW